jgi:hypothetical protein
MAEIARKIKRYPSDLTNEEPMRPKRGRKSALDLRNPQRDQLHGAQCGRQADAADRFWPR